MTDGISTGPSIHQIRRTERKVTDENWIKGFLNEAQYGIVASEQAGQPFMNPLCYVYDEGTRSIYFHTSRQGRFFANMQANPRACFNISRMSGIIAHVEACRFDVAYDSVIVFGEVTLLEDPAQAEGALQLLVKRYLGLLGQETQLKPIPSAALARTAVWRLEIEAWSGKSNSA
jgi:hypothetical protein